MSRRIAPEKWAHFTQLRRMGLNRSKAARQAGISYTSAKAYEEGLPTSSGTAWKKARGEAELPEVIPEEQLSAPARRALSDFGFFRARYMGRISTPWQEEAGYRVVELLETPEKEYLVVNCPPGSGKSTLFTHDIAAWMIVRNRLIRELIGSRTERQAKQYTLRLRRSLERRQPVKADDEFLNLGLAVDAEATLLDDYGRFKPLVNEMWRVEEYIVAQLAGVPLEDKEPTVSAFGMDSGFLGGRYNWALWDDLVDKATIRTEDARDGQRMWWDDEAETRLEPGGLLTLQGQRMGAEDLYRYTLDMAGVELDDIEELDLDRPDIPKKYHHIVYKAHYEERCAGDHGITAKAWPEGCLLDPRRLKWRELATIQKNRSEKYRVLYQQEDVDPANVLVPRLWIDGGRGPDGADYPGCLDLERGLCEYPQGLSGRKYSIVTADPSPTKFWSIQWWLVHPDSESRFLLDLERRPMDANDFLDWNQDAGEFYGLAYDWQVRSIEAHLPITHWIVEANAAQRFLLQYDHVKRWRRKYNVLVVPHQTGMNKTSQEFGPGILKEHYKHGRYRLPYRGEARVASNRLISEVTRYPEATTDDCVMAQWFLEWNLPKIATAPAIAIPTSWRPSWMQSKQALTV